MIQVAIHYIVLPQLTTEASEYSQRQVKQKYYHNGQPVDTEGIIGFIFPVQPDSLINQPVYI